MLPALVVLGALALVYWFGVRRWFAHWGATDVDLARVMAGDAVIAAPTHVQTQAVTVDAPPDAIWPWLVQIGHRRGGLYSYDWLDRLFGYLDRPSADRILPEFQQLAPGDVIPLGRGQGFPVAAVEPQRALVLAGTQEGFEWVWQFGLYPLGDGRTRLVTRGLQRFLGLEPEAVSIAGGIVLFLIALRMIFPDRGASGAEAPEGEPFIVPLAIPLFVGPSTLAALLLLQRTSPGQTGPLLLAVTVAWALSGAILLSSTFFYRVLRARGLIAMERLMGMVLVMIAVQLFMNGLRTFLATG